MITFDRSSPAKSGPGRRTTPLAWFELRRDIPAWLYKMLTALSFASALAAWAWLSHQDFINPIFLPTPERVWGSVQSLLSDHYLWSDIRISLLRVTAGFLLSAVIAVPVGVCIGSFKTLEGLFQPVTEFIRYIPVPALIPMVMLCFGIGELAKIMLIFVGTFFQLVLMVADEIRRVQYDLLQVSYTLGARRSEVLRKVIWRAAMPGIFDALRLCNGWAWTYLVVAELIAANEGLGYRILKFSRFLQTPKIFIYLFLLGCIGLTIDLAFRKFNARLFHWADTTKR
ncbi:MAG TPA: ABC transporter permease [Opitutaceae bacterium]|jgi:NitT/TauT family transport system permease protein|nr:ABC transporter permease [Opitutaceae bacterium]